MFSPPALRQIHPLGKSPVIEDDGRIVVESGAIVEYLVEKAGGQLGPDADRDAALRYRMFLHYAEGSVMPPLLLKLVLGRVPIMGRFASRRIQPSIDVHLDFIEAELAQRPWFAGDRLTAADIMMSFPLEAARARRSGRRPPAYHRVAGEGPVPPDQSARLGGWRTLRLRGPQELRMPRAALTSRAHTQPPSTI